MSLAETELTIGGKSFKGVYIAILLSLATTLGGGVWTASSLYARLEAVEAVTVPSIVPLEEKILLIEQELSSNDVSQLQGKLAALGVNLQTIIDQQAKLLLIDENVNSLEKDIETMKATVAKAELMTNNLTKLDGQLKTISREIEDLWQGMDYLSNPLKQDRDMLDKLIGPVAGLLDKFIPDKDKANALAHEIATMSQKHAQESVLAQLEVNKVEAAHKSLFVSGWRPAIGWICGFALMYSTILAPILGIWFTVPPVDSSLLTSVLMGMLGLGAMRTVEKTKAVARDK